MSIIVLVNHQFLARVVTPVHLSLDPPPPEKNPAGSHAGDT